MTNMISNGSIGFLRRIVNLDGYALSQDFIGYFESERRDFDKSYVAIDLFEDFWGNKINEATLVCSFIVRNLDRNNELHEKVKEQEQLKKATKNKRWILSKLDEEENVLENLQSFSLREEDIDDIRSLLWLVINGFTYGHVFFVWRKRDLIIYPHSDCGFGVLATKDSQDYKTAVNFLDFVKNKNLFNVHIDSATIDHV